ncbi:tellurium resistance protein (plasmid) [Pseudorhodobacter turbinis]|uniref:Tellurium resistance protein n=1 Tax=Pseudorhodobacter turbinis TaxID=2500533 RepID=A0A4P8EJG6_9RHOB|nr:tellurium resistance protein [Pseudorhodobacter turbinis]QCO56845.1 tellurium resistance protein [Pseudorhodobacter turbinis]
MKRAPIFPPPQFPPVKLRAFQRMPPAVFPAIMGLFGLGLVLRRGAEVIGYPSAFAEMVLGAVSILWFFATLGYLLKLRQRPAVIMEDLAILPGRAGLAAMSLGVLLLAATLFPYSLAAAQGLMFAGLAVHAVLAGLIAMALARGPAEGRHVTPVWHLNFVGFIIAGLVAGPLGFVGLGKGILIGTGAVAAGVWAISLVQLIKRVPPAPLRPLLAIHLAPASLLGTVAYLLGMQGLATGFALLGGVILAGLVGSARWITASGFSALWAAFTFPLAAYAGLLLVLATTDDRWAWPGLACLIASIGIVPLIAAKVLQAWSKGALAAKTNAATA